MDEIAAKLIAFKGEDTTNEQSTTIEVTKITNDVIEITFNDRNERVYLQFSLTALLSLVMNMAAKQ